MSHEMPVGLLRSATFIHGSVIDAVMLLETSFVATHEYQYAIPLEAATVVPRDWMLSIKSQPETSSKQNYAHNLLSTA